MAVKFIHVTNPYADATREAIHDKPVKRRIPFYDAEAALTSQILSAVATRVVKVPTGLEALSAVASVNSYSFIPPGTEMKQFSFGRDQTQDLLKHSPPHLSSTVLPLSPEELPVSRSDAMEESTMNFSDITQIDPSLSSYLFPAGISIANRPGESKSEVYREISS